MSPLTPLVQQEQSARTTSTRASSGRGDREYVSASTERKQHSPIEATSTAATSSTTSRKSNIPKLRHRTENSMDNPNNDNNDNADQQFVKLRAALEEANHRDATAKSALAKSDAVILELRSSIRQLRRQVEQLHKEKESSEQHLGKLQNDLNSIETSAKHSFDRERTAHQTEVSKLKQELQISETHAHEEHIGELQVQLDRAHAQILTADMVRKELEDTLEAEQYTWELRVQDQERQIVTLQQDCETLKDDLEQCRKQWKEAEEGWAEEIKLLQEVDREGDVMGRLKMMEQEREELQSCLEEAMKELEAVDQELRQNPNVLDPLQELYAWTMERNGHQIKEIPDNTNELVAEIQQIIDENPLGKDSLKVTELEAQLSVYRGDLKAREESSSELRASLKEAVALLKPLQDAVAKTDREKKDLEEQLAEANEEKDELENKLKAQAISPGSIASITSRSMPSGESQIERSTSARSKRRESEETLQKMLAGAHSKFQTLHHDNSSIVEHNENLQNRVADLERQLIDVKSLGDEESIKRDIAAEMREAAIHHLEQEADGYSKDLQRKELELERMQEELKLALEASSDVPSDYDTIKSQIEELERDVSTKRKIEIELEKVKKDLEMKGEAEAMLNDSLKEALSLLKPLQTHLEIAEKEKKLFAKQLRSAKKKIAKLEGGHCNSRSMNTTSSAMSADNFSEISIAMQHLEDENAQLRPEQTKLKEQVVSLKSRYQVTREKLTSAEVEKEALVSSLKQKDESEKELVEELSILRAKLEKSEHELENAKYIATSALMKVEELTMANLSTTMVRDMLETQSQGNSSTTRDHDPAEVQRLKVQLHTLEQEVQSSHELTQSLNYSLEEQDHALQYLAEQHSESPARRDRAGPRDPRGKGVSFS